MLFNSFPFIVFLLIVLILYRLLRSSFRAQNLLLLVSSYFFYAWWDLRFLFLLILSTSVTYSFGRIIHYGEIEKNKRYQQSLWVVASCFLLVTINWKALDHANILSGGKLLLSDGKAWAIFSVVCIFILALNLLYESFSSLDPQKRRKAVLTIGIAANLAILAFFKYFNFFVENLAALIHDIGFNVKNHHFDILLPLGISFFTFQNISYLVDVYSGKTKSSDRYVDFALFIAFFPKLVAGPIERASNFLVQVSKERGPSRDQIVSGLHLIFYGLFKKVVIADGVAVSVAYVFDTPGSSSWMDIVIASLLFTVQIYGDFSGYTDIARGLANLFGFDLMLNFKNPYFAGNPKEFWSRWHISLSSWLRDYLYIPLGGNRIGRFKMYRNMLITMLLGGLWHGAAWNYVLWGLYHGVLLCISRIKDVKDASRANLDSTFRRMLSIGLFFSLTCYGWLLFRAPSLHKIVSLSSTLLFDFGNFSIGIKRPRVAALIGLPILIIAEFVEHARKEKPFVHTLAVPVWTALYAVILFALIIGLSNEATQFIYMKF